LRVNFDNNTCLIFQILKLNLIMAIPTSMKKSVLSLLISIILFACSSNETDEDGFIGTVVDKEFTIQNSGAVSYYLGELGESGTASIIVQAKHFSVSKLVESQYSYEPQDGYIGEDYVEISSSVRNTTTNGNNVSKNTKTRITIIITE